MENLVLRQQLAVYTRQPKRPRLRNEDRLFGQWSRGPGRLGAPPLHLVQPETVVRWDRTAWRRYWRWKRRGAARGGPRIEPELAELIRRMTRENPR